MDDADYFFVPSIGREPGVRRAALEYVKREHPQLWAERADRHIMVGCNDYGVNEYFGRRTQNEDAMKIIFVDNMGLWLGSKRFVYEGGFIPGQDIVLPPMNGLPPPLVVSAPRNRLFFFAGTVRHDWTTNNVRKAVSAIADSHPDQLVVEGTDKNYIQHMQTSVFCLGAPGKGGGWGRRATLVALHGCIPVILQDNTSMALDELLPWREFAVFHPLSEIERLHDHLASIAADAKLIERMRRQLQAATSYFVMDWEARERDAVVGVFEILKKRLTRTEFPKNGLVKGHGENPSDRHAAIDAAFSGTM